jgi:3-dehydroquinate dehydratase-2
MTRTIFVLNGPNLNLLGKRQPEIYGRETLSDVKAEYRRVGAELGFTIQVHISNIHQREEFRHFSYVSRVAAGVICGLGTNGYPLALQHLAQRFKA